MSTEIMNKLDDVLKNVSDAQTAANDANGRIDKLKEIEIKKYADDSAKALDEVNNLKAKADANEKVLKELETKLMRPGGPGNDDTFNVMYQKSMARYLKKGELISPELIEKSCNEFVNDKLYGVSDEDREYYVKTLIAGINPQGGYWIRPQRLSQMVERIFETSPIRQVANVITTTSDSVQMVIDDNEFGAGGWVGEVQARGVTLTPEIGLLTITIHEQFAQPQATQKMLDDAGFDIEGWLSRKVVDRLSREENTAFVAGDGSKRPKGFLSYDPWILPGDYERGKLEFIVSGNATDFTADGVIALQSSLKEPYQQGAVFMTCRDNWYHLITKKDGIGAYLINPQLFHDSTDKILLGKKVIFASDIPVVAGNALALAYGDFGRGYTIVDRLGFRVIRDEVTAKPYVKFYTTKRTGGAVTNYEAIKIQKIEV